MLCIFAKIEEEYGNILNIRNALSPECITFKDVSDAGKPYNQYSAPLRAER